MANHQPVADVLISRARASRIERMASDRETMRRDRVEFWLEGLESDRFGQCTSYLETTHLETGKVTNCAIGVGVRVFMEQTGLNAPRSTEQVDHLSNFQTQASRWYGIERMDLVLTHDNESPLGGATVTDLNDNFEMPFAQIAQQIRKDYF